MEKKEKEKNFAKYLYSRFRYATRQIQRGAEGRELKY